MIAGSTPCDRSRPGKNNSSAAAQNISFAKRDFIFPFFQVFFSSRKLHKVITPMPSFSRDRLVIWTKPEPRPGARGAPFLAREVGRSQHRFRRAARLMWGQPPPAVPSGRWHFAPFLLAAASALVNSYKLVSRVSPIISDHYPSGLRCPCKHRIGR